MALGSVKFSSAASPCSRPRPDSPDPPQRQPNIGVTVGVDPHRAGLHAGGHAMPPVRCPRSRRPPPDYRRSRSRSESHPSSSSNGMTDKERVRKFPPVRSAFHGQHFAKHGGVRRSSRDRPLERRRSRRRRPRTCRRHIVEHGLHLACRNHGTHGRPLGRWVADANGASARGNAIIISS